MEEHSSTELHKRMTEYFKLPDEHNHLTPPTYKISAIRPATEKPAAARKKPDTTPSARTHKYKCVIIMPVYNRYLYARIALFCLRRSLLENSLIVFLDDASDDPRVLDLLDKFRHKEADTMLISRQKDKDPDPKHKGSFSLSQNLAYCMHRLFSNKFSPYIAVLDSDTLCKRLWLPKLMSIYTKAKEDSHRNKPLIVSGFNTNTYQTLGEGDDKSFYFKELLGGISMLFDELTYHKVFIPMDCYWDNVVSCRMNEASPMSLLCSKPSVVQHIGLKGINSHMIYLDFAYDYAMPAWFGKLIHKIQWTLIHWRQHSLAKKKPVRD